MNNKQHLPQALILPLGAAIAFLAAEYLLRGLDQPSVSPSSRRRHLLGSCAPAPYPLMLRVCHAPRSAKKFACLDRRPRPVAKGTRPCKRLPWPTLHSVCLAVQVQEDHTCTCGWCKLHRASCDGGSDE